MEVFLTIFPFVYINRCENDTLFYNTITGDSIIFKNNFLLSELVDRLEQQDYACIINKEEMDVLNQIDFFKLLIERKLGYYIDKKHFQVLPVTTRCAEINDRDFLARFRNNEYIMENLREVTFYINNDKNILNSINQIRSHKPHKQFLFPIYNSQKRELSLSKIKQIIDEIEINKLNINILGGNIFKYSQIESLINCLNKTTYHICYYFHYNDWLDYYSQQIFSLINENDTKIILVDFPFDETQFRLWESVIEQKNIHIIFLIETDKQMEEAEDVIDRFNLKNYIFRPYFNGNNYAFFKNNVLVSEDDLLSIKISLFELITRKISNPTFFGKLFIDVQENIYSNINEPPISSINSMNLKRLIYDLINDEKSIWLKSKHKVDPCNKCIYNLLCPPISNYELVLEKNNLCNIGV